MIYREEKRDLFELNSNEWLFAHCISSDFKLGAGIALQFAKNGVREALVKSYQKEWNGEGYAILTESNGFVVMNLVTKEKYYHKPTYVTLREAIISMKTQLMHANLKKIAMPRIGCGLDKLSWNEVKSIIEDVFGNTDAEIVVCYNH